MKKAQKEFLLKTFFETDRFAGWKNIAEALIDTGKCIVAGEGSLWVGGIGNFIKTNPAQNAIDCTELTFDLKSFVSTDNLYFTEGFNSHIEWLKAEKTKKEEYLKYLSDSIESLESLIY